MSRDIDAILFDKDGTLVDFEKTWVSWAITMLDRFADGDPSLYRRLAEAVEFDPIRKAFLPTSPVIAGTLDEIARPLAEALSMPHDALVEALNTEAANAPLVEVVPLMPLLKRLKAHGMALGVATNDAERPTHAHLETLGVTHLFDFVAGFDSGHGSKPGPGMCRAFCEAVNVAPNRAVMVGDSLHDLHAGRAAGLNTIAVLSGMASAQVLAPTADAVLPDIGHLPEWLGLSNPPD